MGMGVSFQGDENLWEPDRGGGCTQNCEGTNCHLIVHFKMVTYVNVLIKI